MSNYKKDVGDNASNFYSHTVLESNTTSRLAFIVQFICAVAFVVCIILAGFVVENQNGRFALFVAAVLLLAFGVKNALNIHKGKPYYECLACHKQYTPTVTAFLKGRRRGMMYKLTCPHCRNNVWHKKDFKK